MNMWGEHEHVQRTCALTTRRTQHVKNMCRHECAPTTLSYEHVQERTCQGEHEHDQRRSGEHEYVHQRRSGEHEHVHQRRSGERNRVCVCVCVSGSRHFADGSEGRDRKRLQTGKEEVKRRDTSLLPIWDMGPETTRETRETREDQRGPERTRGDGEDGEDRFIRGKLPGGYNYLHVTTPTPTDLTPPPPVPQDRRIVTGHVETGNYFSLHLDCYERVDTITCFSLKPLPVSNYLSLYGKHQQLLGQLLTRYHQDLIHDLFCDLEQELQQITAHTLQGDAEQETATATDCGAFKDAASRAALRHRAVKYLNFNRNLLPMFSCPGQL
ncbi:hypothetical protein JOB18_022759 [Solea senegalensis]|uniref:CFAP61 dimerisation domain-containing protein n=1 Tax=Solea senegalensis TaxID=28829 RepID=A0AAV6PLR9_SOLSE|nr:hypothetical protein JOB18_022759 [Solea senegalensis]